MIQVTNPEIFDRFVERLRSERHEVPDGLILHRTYAGPRGRERGAWSWYASDRSARAWMASWDSLSTLLSSKEPLVLVRRDGREPWIICRHEDV